MHRASRICLLIFSHKQLGLTAFLLRAPSDSPLSFRTVVSSLLLYQKSILLSTDLTECSPPRHYFQHAVQTGTPAFVQPTETQKVCIKFLDKPQKVWYTIKLKYYIKFAAFLPLSYRKELPK